MMVREKKNTNIKFSRANFLQPRNLRRLLIIDDNYEDEEYEYRPRAYQPRINFVLPTPNLFRESFRVDQQVVEKIEWFIGRFIQRQTRRSHALTVREQILITLHFLGNGSIYHLNGYSVGVTKGTVCQCIHSVCGLITRYVMPLFVRWPANPHDISAQFFRKAGFPCVKGIIDGTLIRINAPTVDEPIFVSRNNKHAINLLVVSGPRHEFLFASAKCPGSFHDSRCLRVSALWQSWEINGYRPEDDPRSIILGDSAYPLTSWLMTPTIRNVNRVAHLEDAAARYQRRHRKTRFMVECAIGILKHQFYCLRYGFRFTRTSRVCAAIYTCITLHNMQNFVRHGSYDYDANLNRIANGQYNEDDEIPIPEEENDGPNDFHDGARRQRELIEYFVRPNI